MNTRKYYVYILASKPFGAIYIGVTNDVAHRVMEHRSGQGSQHTAKYKIFRLVYWEDYDYVNDGRCGMVIPPTPCRLLLALRRNWPIAIQSRRR